MSEEVEKCPKCSGDMELGGVHGDFRILKHGDLYGDKMYVFYCRECGFVEFYKERSTKEHWRWPNEQEPPSTEEARQPEMEKPLSKKPSRRRLVR